MAQWQQWRHNRRGGRGLWWPRPTFSQFVALLVKSIDSQQHGSVRSILWRPHGDGGMQYIVQARRQQWLGRSSNMGSTSSSAMWAKTASKKTVQPLQRKEATTGEFCASWNFFTRVHSLKRGIFWFSTYRVQSPPICCQHTNSMPYVHFWDPKSILQLTPSV